MTLDAYRKSCWPNYNPYYGVDADGVTAELRHLDYLNCIWQEGPYEFLNLNGTDLARLERRKRCLTGVPLGQLNLRAIFV